MATADEFRSVLHGLFAQAAADGKPYIDIVSGDLHERGQRMNPTRSQRLPNCCSVMRQEQKSGDTVISARASDGVSFAVRYRLPR